VETENAEERSQEVNYLVMACRAGHVRRHTCTSVASASIAAHLYRKWGWGVTVLPGVER
jgi:hypothetical protein